MKVAFTNESNRGTDTTPELITQRHNPSTSHSGQEADTLQGDMDFTADFLRGAKENEDSRHRRSQAATTSQDAPPAVSNQPPSQMAQATLQGSRPDRQFNRSTKVPPTHAVSGKI